MPAWNASCHYAVLGYNNYVHLSVVLESQHFMTWSMSKAAAAWEDGELINTLSV